MTRRSNYLEDRLFLKLRGNFWSEIYYEYLDSNCDIRLAEKFYSAIVLVVMK